jgi:ATP-binding cassette subfamily B multidrug efflux pump
MFSFFESLVEPFPENRDEQPPYGLYEFCRFYTRGMEFRVLVVMLLASAIAALEMLLYGFLGQLVDWLGTKNPNTFLWEERWTLIGLGLLVLVVKPILGGLQGLAIYQTLLGNYPMRIRHLAHGYLLEQSWSFYQGEFSGRLATKVMQTALSVRETVLKLADVFVYVTVQFFSMIILVASCDLRLVIPMVVWLVCYVGVLFYYVPKLGRASELQADARAEMTGRMVDSYTNISTVKLFAHTGSEATYARESMRDFLATVYPQMRLVTKLQVSICLLNAGLIFSVGCLSILLWQSQFISPGAMAISLALALRFDGVSQWIMWEVSALFENIGSVRDGMDTLSQPRKVCDLNSASELQVTKGRIVFDRVHFGYGEHDAVFKGISLTIEPGERVGIVGRSGAGKSTLVSLLLRLYDIDDGSITIDGQSVREVTQDSVRAAIGVVTQDTALLHRSVLENIRYGRPESTESEVMQAAMRAEAHDFILRLRDRGGRLGYAATVGERGAKLSGGQRQRIAIARVLLKNAPVLVLDEATSALDSEAELAIKDCLDELMKGKTVIAIAHRLSTIASLDRLVVLDEGRILEQGTHNELLKSGGLYSQLWAHQSGGFLGLE